MSTFDILVEVVAEELKTTPDEVRKATSLVELNVDSLAMIEVIMAAEDRLKVVISDRDLVGVTSLADIAAVIDRTLAKQSAPLPVGAQPDTPTEGAPLDNDMPADATDAAG